MSVRCLGAILLTVASLGYAVPVQAQGLRDDFRAFMDSVILDFQRNNCWPQPFVGPDRHAVRAPFVLMVHNGWRRQNMLSDHHFEEGAATLNEAGRLKTRWIMTEAPRHHRTVYVHRAGTPDQTAARIAAVEQYAAQHAEEGQPIVVRETNIDARGWPATRVDLIDRRWAESTPDPKLPDANPSSSE